MPYDEGVRLIIAVPYRRRLLMLNVTVLPGGDEDTVLETLAKIVAPTFADD